MADRLRIRRVILANHVFLLFAWLQTANAHVEPPTNVTFHCHNLHDLLQWSYDQPVTGLRFRVDIRSVESPPVEVWVDPPALHANVSLLTDPADDNLLSVTAVVGKNESEAAPADGITFSYVRNSLVNQKCSVDFPPVAINVDLNGHIGFDFKHPWLLYGSKLPPAKSRQKKSNKEKIPTRIPEFTYTVKVNEHLEEKFVCDTNVCEGKLPVDPGRDRQCLNVEGEMKMMFVQASQEYCASSFTPLLQEQNKDIYIIAGVLTTVAVIAFAVVVFIVYRKMTNPSTFSPNSMIITGRRNLGTLKLSQDLVSVPEVHQRSPTPLLTNEIGDEDETPAGPSTEPDLRLRLGVENGVAGEGCSGGSQYMSGSELEEAPINESPYEKRPVVRVELVPGETAEGYRV